MDSSGFIGANGYRNPSN